MTRLVVLAAGRGTRLGAAAEGAPKCMVPLHGIPLGRWHVRSAREGGAEGVIAVSGFACERLDLGADAVVHNEQYASTSMIGSLRVALDELKDDDLMTGYGDIVYRPAVMRSLLHARGDVVVVSDRAWEGYWRARMANVLSDAESFLADDEDRVRDLGARVHDLAQIQGQYIGLVRFRGEGLASARRLIATGAFDQLPMTSLIQGLADRGADVRAAWIEGGWLEIDTPEDLRVAHALTHVEDGQLVIDR